MYFVCLHLHLCCIYMCSTNIWAMCCCFFIKRKNRRSSLSTLRQFLVLPSHLCLELHLCNPDREGCMEVRVTSSQQSTSPQWPWNQDGKQPLTDTEASSRPGNHAVRRWFYCWVWILALWHWLSWDYYNCAMNNCLDVNSSGTVWSY